MLSIEASRPDGRAKWQNGGKARMWRLISYKYRGETSRQSYGDLVYGLTEEAVYPVD